MNHHLDEVAESIGLTNTYRQHNTPVDVTPEMNEVFELEYDADDDDITDLDALTSTAFIASKASKAAKVVADKQAKENEKQRIIQNRVIERERAAAEKRMEKMRREAERAAKKKPAAAPARRVADDDTDSMYDDIATPLVGLEHRKLTMKIQQYKQLFADNAAVKKFKIKKNATPADLQAAIDELDGIVSISTVDDFLTEAIVASIKVAEGFTANMQSYNITGLSEILRHNTEFNNLCKICAVKYGAFSAVPPETQLIFIVATSAYIMMSKNSKKREINAYLNMPVGSTYEPTRSVVATPPVVAESKDLNVSEKT